MNLYGYKIYKETPLELCYNVKNDLICNYVLISNGCCPFYCKIEKSNPVEFYPWFNKTIQDTVESFKNGNIKNINDTYISYDLKNFPTEIYKPNRNKIYKYRNNKLETVYTTLSFVGYIISDTLKNEWMIKCQPDYVITSEKNGIKYNTVFGYKYGNPNYSEIKEKFFNNLSL